MIVVDANILAYFWLKSPHFEKVASLYQAEPEWITPELCRSEFRSIAAQYLRKGYYSIEEILTIIAHKESKMLGSYLEVESNDVLMLVNQSTCSAYDCEYVALARKFSRPLITFDKKIQTEFPSIAVSVDQFLS
jgi:predicted nucleic acid-binding protein